MHTRHLTRRALIGSATAAGVAATAATWLGDVRSADAKAAPTSALRTGQLVAMGYESLPGFLSKHQVGLHHAKHYGGALKGFQGIEKRLYARAGVTDRAARRELGKAQSAKANSVILHELYFGGMRAEATAPPATLANALQQRFGSLDRWRADFEACALSCSGWAMLAAHPLNDRLYHVSSDAHDVGPLWFARPLLLIDMYEHAFYVDYRTDKAAYVARFFEHIDWTAAERRWKASR